MSCLPSEERDGNDRASGVTPKRIKHSLKKQHLSVVSQIFTPAPAGTPEAFWSPTPEPVELIYFVQLWQDSIIPQSHFIPVTKRIRGCTSKLVSDWHHFASNATECRYCHCIANFLCLASSITSPTFHSLQTPFC